MEALVPFLTLVQIMYKWCLLEKWHVSMLHFLKILDECSGTSENLHYDQLVQWGVILWTGIQFTFPSF